MNGMHQQQQPYGAGPGAGMSMAGAGTQISLVQSSLWNEFHRAQTEMIVTKSGRKLFPKLEITIHGLDPRRMYGIHMRLERADDKKYRYTSSTWSTAKDDDDACFPLAPPIESNEGFTQLGEVWMSKAVEFSNFKITNNQEESSRGMILVQTLHKYVPVIYIYDMAPGTSYSQLVQGLVFSERLTLAEFITVTAYQSEAIKRLKTAHNPFAKGCRGSESKLKRSHSPAASPSLLGHRSIDGEPPSRLASPAFPNMASMMPSPSYTTATVPHTMHSTVPQQSNPFPSPPQETRASPSVPQQQNHFEFPPNLQFPGFEPYSMMPAFPFSFFPHMMTGLAGPPMDYGSMQLQQQQQYLPAPYTPQMGAQSPASSSSNQTSPANSSGSAPPYTPMGFQMGQMQSPNYKPVLPPGMNQQDDGEDNPNMLNL